jgi:hypothetical protein
MAIDPVTATLAAELESHAFGKPAKLREPEPGGIPDGFRKDLIALGHAGNPIRGRLRMVPLSVPYCKAEGLRG